MRLDRWLRQTAYALVGILFATGAGWLLVDRFEDFSRGEVWQEISAYLLMVHGGAAMLFLLLLGALSALHVRIAWRVGKNRAMGMVMLTSNALLVGTAFGLYYFGSEALRRWTSDLHIAVGLGFPTLLVLHVIVGRRSVAPVKEGFPRRERRHRGGDHRPGNKAIAADSIQKLGG